MSIQSDIFTDAANQLGGRTFQISKHIPTKQHMAVWLYNIQTSAWEQMDSNLYQLINNACVLDNPVTTSLYSKMEIRVGDTQDELTDSPTDITTVANNVDKISVLADNIDIISSSTNRDYIVSGLPSVAENGDIAVNLLDGGIYERQSGEWVLVATSAGVSGSEVATATAVVNSVDGLPSTAESGEIVYNTIDDYYYAYIAGEWTVVTSPPQDINGIEVVATVTGLDRPVDTVVFAQDTNQLMKSTGVETWVQVVEPTGAVATIGDGTIEAIHFANGITPVEIFATEPTTGNFIGRTYYNSTDGKLYRHTATGFTAAVPTTDLTGTITETQIADDAITTPAIATGAVTADSIAANAVTAGSIAADAVTAGTIAAGVVGATEIAANSITATAIQAGAVTANSLAANSVSSTSIQADAITSIHVAANAIDAGMIQAGIINSNHIAANAVTSNAILADSITGSKIASYAIDATHIQAGAITADKITNGTTTIGAGTFSVGEGTTVGGYSGVAAFNTNSSTSVGLIATSNLGDGLAFGSGSKSASGYTAGFYNCNTAGNYNNVSLADMVVGIGRKDLGILVEDNNGNTDVFLGVNAPASPSGQAMAAYFRNNTESTRVRLCENGGWVLIAHGTQYNYGNITATGSIDAQGGFYKNGVFIAFTGGHLSLSNEEIAPGDIVYVNDTYNLDISKTFQVIGSTTTSSDKRVFGVAGRKVVDDEKIEAISAFTKTPDSPDGPGIFLSAEDEAFYNDAMNTNLYETQSLGEGLINVCGENGNIEAGDLIVSSNTVGKGMKQDDDIMRSSTVAKALESAVFDSTTQVKQIACTYHCG